PWLERRQPSDGDVLKASLPAVVAAAGIAILFASVFAAHALYDLIGSALAFPLLAGISALAVILSLVLGPAIAGLGLLGAFVVPLLVRSTDPSALILFGYLLIVVTGALAVVRRRAWWWLGWGVLAGTTAWPILWLLTLHVGGAVLVTGLRIVCVYLVLV